MYIDQIQHENISAAVPMVFIGFLIIETIVTTAKVIEEACSLETSILMPYASSILTANLLHLEVGTGSESLMAGPEFTFMSAVEEFISEELAFSWPVESDDELADLIMMLELSFQASEVNTMA